MSLLKVRLYHGPVVNRVQCDGCAVVKTLPSEQQCSKCGQDLPAGDCREDNWRQWSYLGERFDSCSCACFLESCQRLATNVNEKYDIGPVYFDLREQAHRMWPPSARSGSDT